jgi:hypothetical protein
MLRSLKSKRLSKRVNEKRLKEACSTAVTGFQTTLSISKNAIGLAGVPGLQAGVTSLLVVIDVIKVCHMSLRLYLKFFYVPRSGNFTKRGDCRETRKPDRETECPSQQRQDRKNISSGDH